MEVIRNSLENIFDKKFKEGLKMILKTEKIEKTLF